MPLVQLDYVYARGLTPLGVQVPSGRIWGRMSVKGPLGAFRVKDRVKVLFDVTFAPPPADASGASPQPA